MWINSVGVRRGNGKGGLLGSTYIVDVWESIWWNLNKSDGTIADIVAGHGLE